MEGESLKWILQFLGRLHPLCVHFPIGLLVVGGFLELLTIGRKRQSLRHGINWMIYIGALFAVMAAMLGWMLRANDDYSGELVDFHQNMGITTAVLATLTALLLYRKMYNTSGSYAPYRLVLLITVVCLSIAGHLGANLTHGEDFLTSVLPGNQKIQNSEKSNELLAELKATTILTDVQHNKLNMEVRAIFAHNCYQCHNENKQKGGLALDTKDGVFNGGESGLAVVAGKPKESELYKRIILSPKDKEIMPKKGKVLAAEEIALIKLWIEEGAQWSDQTLKVFPEAQLALSKPDLPNNTNQTNPVDQLMSTYFEKNGVRWPQVVDDRTFIRRAYLDVIGLLPEPQQVQQFLENKNENKRKVLIDELLNDSKNYTEHWLSFWNDLLRNDYSGPGFITGGRRQITAWLYSALEQNKPYDVMVKQLVNPTDASEGFIKGIEWRGVVNASQRTEMQAAQNIGQSLMGVNVKCASCHNSFVSNLTLEQSYGFATIFANSQLELNRCDKPIGKMATPNFLYAELGSVAAETVQERLSLLSEVMVKPENGRLYRTITNRIWKRLLGRGIIESVDEMDNTPWNTELLDWLAADLIDSGYDLKHLIRIIMTSRAYQLPTVNYTTKEDIKTEYVFKGPILRRISAEQFSDAVSQVLAPAYYATAYNPDGNNLNENRIWHREVKFEQNVLPNPGTRYFRKEIILHDTDLTNAELLVSVDHSYTMYINGKEISKGNDWRKVDHINVTDFLLKGKKNVIAIAGINEGNIANPAGILFAMKITYADGKEQSIGSDTNWKCTATLPNQSWTAIDFEDTGWENVRNYGSSYWGNLINFSFETKKQKYARASLVEQHPFMKALGRPTRENVTTTRDEQATLLQALELTNGAYFNDILEEGATLWMKKYGNDGAKIVESLYQELFGRNPTEKERDIMLATFGESPDKEALKDLFWAVLILPEFQFIY
tara:strand:- start:72087 stop:74933 length:2847 start_codon:yes stop_codon:yes gene_type:complete